MDLEEPRSSARNVPSGEERGETDVFPACYCQRETRESCIPNCSHLLSILNIVFFPNPASRALIIGESRFLGSQSYPESR